MTESPMLTPEAGVPAVLGSAFWDAVQWASELHAQQIRKGKPTVPYMVHLLGVAALVLEAGGTETEAVAALLHDSIEDAGTSADEIEARFGTKVAAIVVACTDDLAATSDDAAVAPRGKGDWHARKQAYLEHLRAETDPSVLAVAAADKLNNAHAIVADIRAAAGPGAWARFNAPPEDQLGYYRSLCAAFGSDTPEFLSRELRAAVDEIVRLTDLDAETAAWHAAQEGEASDH